MYALENTDTVAAPTVRFVHQHDPIRLVIYQFANFVSKTTYPICLTYPYSRAPSYLKRKKTKRPCKPKTYEDTSWIPSSPLSNAILCLYLPPESPRRREESASSFSRQREGEQSRPVQISPVPPARSLRIHIPHLPSPSRTHVRSGHPFNPSTGPSIPPPGPGRQPASLT